MGNNLNKDEIFILLSNVTFASPVIFATNYHEWLYLFFASGVFIFSPLYHWYQIKYKSTFFYRVFERCDLFFAIGSFAYMYIYTYIYTPREYKLILFIFLTLAILLYWFGLKRNYEKLHPWFHIAVATVSTAILVLTH